MKNNCNAIILVILAAALGVSSCWAFVTPVRLGWTTPNISSDTTCPGLEQRTAASPFSRGFITKHQPLHQRSIGRRSLVRLRGGLFGLGGAELIVILIAAAFVIGPQGLSSLAKSTGEVTGGLKEEFKDVPTEFKKGMEEGEIDARARKAKPMKRVTKAEEEQGESSES